MARSVPADSRHLRGPDGITGIVHVLFSDDALSFPSPAFRAVIALLPLLVFYVVLVVTFARPSFQGDEGGYVKLAMNLARGFYSLSSPVDIWWGPGYPLLLAPFALLRIPWIAAKLANALFLFLASVFIYFTLRAYGVRHGRALAAAYVVGLYPPHLREIFQLMTEPLAFCLVAAMTLGYCALSRSAR